MCWDSEPRYYFYQLEFLGYEGTTRLIFQSRLKLSQSDFEWVVKDALANAAVELSLEHDGLGNRGFISLYHHERFSETMARQGFDQAVFHGSMELYEDAEIYPNPKHPDVAMRRSHKKSMEVAEYIRNSIYIDRNDVLDDQGRAN